MKDTLKLTLRNKFGFKERMKILVGFEMVNEAECEVEFKPSKGKKGSNMTTTVIGLKTWVVRPFITQPIQNDAGRT